MRRKAWLILPLMVAALTGALVLLCWSELGWQRRDNALTAATLSPPLVPLEKEDIAFLIGHSRLNVGRLDKMTIKAGPNRHFIVETTIDSELQSYATRLLQAAKAPRAALVALDPETGRVLALASWSSRPEKINYALDPAFPAASVFKMVTAAAALEEGGLTPSSRIPYRGGPYTLYRSQIIGGKERSTSQPSLTESFARSINPVFGKLALNSIGSSQLEEFARRFGFNEAIRFELPVHPSQVHVPSDDSLALAAVGCGFNRETTLSPLHGALMAGAVINRGTMMEPTVVKRVLLLSKSKPAFEVYTSQPQALSQAMTKETAARMRPLMQATITKGTCRTAFRGAAKDPVLSKLEIGGKTGSINDSSQTYRVDWFVGYAQEKGTGRGLALGVLVAHNLERRGVRASSLARQVFSFHFGQAAKTAQGQNSQGLEAKPPPPAKPAEPQKMKALKPSSKVGSS